MDERREDRTVREPLVPSIEFLELGAMAAFSCWANLPLAARILPASSPPLAPGACRAVVPGVRLRGSQFQRRSFDPGHAAVILAVVEEEHRPVWVKLAAAASAAAVAVILSTGFALGDKIGYYTRYAAEYKRRGMELFVEGDLNGSLEFFDKCLEVLPDDLPYLWQRGLTLFYLNKFEEAATQFRENIKARPDDTEELVWCFLCDAHIDGLEEARKRLPPIGDDDRPFMNKIYELYKNGGDPQQMLSDLGVDDGQEYFYMALYAALYYDAQKNLEAAKATMEAACRSSYGSKAKDYVAYITKIHSKTRNWELVPATS
ncbi:uncharacterized protein LOC112346547 [Selaginella moellendorffii]|uniref:uncharacterized protein LOC112346547 n=1 Tax=Selaginella moellendorffii TaxID=88036 RepID=UPI000D1CF2B6|nr:uncharacterized protein LOC112346547 [Selaginella moellendorffii]|eukprot:XP_024531544.1 uncharacterized protein LOC112346547 [Selaginella moellendorffii]